MELRHLRYFIAVAEERHFGRAAARLHMAQPPLSQQIRALEAELGVQLLERTTRSVNLTAAGAAYLDRARALVAGIDAAGEEARQIDAGALGHLTIGCVGSATYNLLPALSRRLDRDLPGINFSFRGEMLVPDQVADLHSGAIDLGLLRPPLADLDLRIQVIRKDRLMVAAPADHPLAQRSQIRPQDLADADLIIHSADRRSAMYAVTTALLRDAGVQPKIRHEVGETSTLVTLVAGGRGVAVVPESVAALTLAGVVYRPLVASARASIDLAVAMRADRHEPHLLRCFELITSLLPQP